MSIIICGPAKGKEKQYRCPVCGFEDDNAENFAVGMCWNCVYPENITHGTISVESFRKGDSVDPTTN